MLLKLFACVILIWTIIHQGTSRYVLSDLRIPWLQAAEIQTKVFAIPDIISLHSYKNLLKNEEEVWVGYFQRHIAIAYVGCASIDDHPFISVDFNKNYSPGLCLSLCIKWKKAQPIVGLSHNKCICLSSLPRSGVNKPGCDFQKTDWVDGDGDNIMALYEKKDEQFMKVIDGGQRWHLSWAEYIEKCSFYKCNPITYEDVLNRPNQLYDLAKSLSWTRLKQSIEIYEYNEYNNTIVNTAYGYIKRQGEHIILNFTKDGSVSKRALFEIYDNIGSSSYKTSSTATSSASTVSPPTETTTEKSNPKEAKQIHPNSDVGVSVGISVTVISVVASIIIIVILKRRGKIQMKCFRKAKSECSAKISTGIHPSSKNDENAYEMSLGSPYDQIDDLGLPSEPCSDNDGTDNVISGHTYFILEKHTWESNTDDNLDNKTKTDTCNVYNALNSNGNNTGSNESGNTYDTTEKVAMKLKVQHNKNVGDDSTENTYNHTCRRPVKVGKTDNVYGILNNVEGEYDDVDTRN